MKIIRKRGDKISEKFQYTNIKRNADTNHSLLYVCQGSTPFGFVTVSSALSKLKVVTGAKGNHGGICNTATSQTQQVQSSSQS